MKLAESIYFVTLSVLMIASTIALWYPIIDSYETEAEKEAERIATQKVLTDYLEWDAANPDRGHIVFDGKDCIHIWKDADGTYQCEGESTNPWTTGHIEIKDIYLCAGPGPDADCVLAEPIPSPQP